MGDIQNLYIIIVGCGHLGSYLANKLSYQGHSVVVVDINESAFDSLTAEFSGFKLEGDATEFAVLKEAKADKADFVISTTGEDNINLMVAQVASNFFKVPKVLARVIEPEREEIYGKFNIKTICPTLIAGDIFLKSIKESEEIKKGEQG